MLEKYKTEGFCGGCINRLYPGIHGYSVRDTACLWKVTEELCVTQLITARLEYERLY